MDNNTGPSPPQYLLQIVEDAIRKKTISWTKPDCGLSSALRYSVQFDDNSKVFVKAATDGETEEWLRTEHLVLSSVKSEFMPYVVDWIDIPGSHPILISEDLSHAYWPASHRGVTWRGGDFDLLFSSLKELSFQPAPIGLPALEIKRTSIWSEIADNPEAFLKLNVCSEEWLGRSVGTLVEAETDHDVTGTCLVHGDIRSDNICFLGSKVVFVDWSHASRGYGLHDLATVLPTLHLEGGPSPYQVMPDGGPEASISCAGHFKRLTADHQMQEWLKKVFRQLIAIELEWAAQSLDLDEPDGTRWRDF